MAGNTSETVGSRVLPLPELPDASELLKYLQSLQSTTPVVVASSTASSTAVSTTESIPSTSTSLTAQINATSPLSTSLASSTSAFSAATTETTQLLSTAATSTYVSEVFPNLLESNRFFPLYCSKETWLRCSKTPLNACDTCSHSGAATFLSILVLLALVIVVANSVVLLVVRNKRRKAKLDNMDMHRISLAVADILTGVQTLIVPVFNFAWVMNSNTIQILDTVVLYRDSPAAKLGGIFFVFTYTASLFNLLYLAAQRLYAFVRPIHYKLQRRRTVGVGLMAMWMLAIITATVPAWVPKDLVYGFAPNTLLFYPATKDGADLGIVLGLMGVMYVLPYLLTVAMIFASACIVFEHMKRSSKPVTTYSSPKDENSNSGEIQFFITSTFMIVGFTLVSLPIVGVVIYQYANSGTNVDLLYVICFYISMANSLVNVMVYSARDPKFRQSVRELFCGACGKYSLEKGVLSKRKRVRSPSESFTNTGTTSNGVRKHSTKSG